MLVSVKVTYPWATAPLCLRPASDNGDVTLINVHRSKNHKNINWLIARSRNHSEAASSGSFTRNPFG